MRASRGTLGAGEVVFQREENSILTIRVEGEVFGGRNCLGTGARAGAGEGHRKHQVCPEPGARPLSTERWAGSEPRSLTVAFGHLFIGCTPKLLFLTHTPLFFYYRNICIEQY